MNKKKIINDPIYGFISISHEIIFDCISHPYFQRLRYIKQLGLSHLVYPGAQHTRFQHVLGAMHLMGKAIESLRSKGVDIDVEEEKGVLLAILLHDIGHGPFSHSLEHALLDGVDHEKISLKLMQKLNQEYNGQLDIALAIFKDEYPKHFLHQLVSSQLDMDRLDYLRRDSFYTGVSEGTIGIERIIQMLNVHEDQLVVDQKGIYSIEKFIMARRFMYWQVYLHKTSLAADQLMLSILRRAKNLIQNGFVLHATPALYYFLKHRVDENALNNDEDLLQYYCQLDDADILSAIKVWKQSDDPILSELCLMITSRNLPKISISNKEFSDDEIERVITTVSKKLNISKEDTQYFVYYGELVNRTYSSSSEQINILYKDGSVGDISNASETYTYLEKTAPTVKYFISYPK